MDSEEDIDEVIHRQSEYFEALSNAIRLKILFYLDKVEKDNVSNIANEINYSQNKVSHHLRIMKLTDLIAARTKGRRRFYWVKRPEVVELCKKFRDLLQRDEDVS